MNRVATSNPTKHNTRGQGARGCVLLISLYDWLTSSNCFLTSAASHPQR